MRESRKNLFPDSDSPRETYDTPRTGTPMYSTVHSCSSEVGSSLQRTHDGGKKQQKTHRTYLLSILSREEQGVVEERRKRVVTRAFWLIAGTVSYSVVRTTILVALSS